jgi:hypothetical protein
MNDKDKEVFEKWFKSMGEYYGLGFEWHKSFHLSTWKAAIEYKQKEYSNLMDAMTQTSQNNAKLVAENKKLHEALCFYACHSIQDDNFVLKNGIATQKTAREALKEVCEE